jgi:RNA methyltransferase, TrmH family
MEKITSLQNPRIKNIVHLSKSRERKLQNLIVVEGFREINMALMHGYVLKELFFTGEVNLHPDFEQFQKEKTISGLMTEISKEVFEKVAYRENSDGLLALFEPKYQRIETLKLSANPLLLVMESVEKPGNLGALLRTADAAALDAIIVCDQQTDIFNPNVIRSSLGCIFSQQVVACTTEETLSFLRKKNITSFAAALTAKKFYHQTDFTKPCAIVMGTEANGLTDKWLTGADSQIKIPMSGKVDSLNVSTSAAILVFEAKRQRGF